MKLGVYGGAFDPPHNAHVALARAAVEQVGLDELRVFPTGHAWHRSGSVAPARHRLAMTKLAFDGLPKVVVDDREMRRAGPTYTIDTLRELRRELPHAQLFLVIGEDQARAFTTWHEWAEIARIATLCVAHRASTGSARTDKPVHPETDKPVHPESDEPVHPETDRPIRPETDKPIRPETDRPVHREMNKPVRPELVEGLRAASIITLQLPSMPESATAIREHVARGEAVFSLVPPAVAGYIASHHLYQGH